MGELSHNPLNVSTSSFLGQNCKFPFKITNLPIFFSLRMFLYLFTYFYGTIRIRKLKTFARLTMWKAPGTVLKSYRFPRYRSWCESALKVHQREDWFDYVLVAWCLLVKELVMKLAWGDVPYNCVFLRNCFYVYDCWVFA